MDKNIDFLIIFIYHNIFNAERNKIFRYKNITEIVRDLCNITVLRITSQFKRKLTDVSDMHLRSRLDNLFDVKSRPLFALKYQMFKIKEINCSQLT